MQEGHYMEHNRVERLARCWVTLLFVHHLSADHTTAGPQMTSWRMVLRCSMIGVIIVNDMIIMIIIVKVIITIITIIN